MSGWLATTGIVLVNGMEIFSMILIMQLLFGVKPFKRMWSYPVLFAGICVWCYPDRRASRACGNRGHTVVSFICDVRFSHADDRHHAGT